MGKGKFTISTGPFSAAMLNYVKIPEGKIIATHMILGGLGGFGLMMADGS